MDSFRLILLILNLVYCFVTATINCPPGWIDDAMGTNCVACPTGSFAPADGGISCQACPSGQYCPNVAMRSPLPCPLGNYCPESTSIPIRCNIGFYAPFTAMSACISCSGGSYSSNTGASSCDFCPNGLPLGRSGVDVLSGTRYMFSAVSVGSLAIFAGGMSTSTLAALNTADIFDFTTRKWTVTFNSFGVSRGAYAAVSVGDVAIFGGGLLSGGGVTASVDMFDAPLNIWSTNVTRLSVPRYALSAAAVSGIAYFAGGSISGGSAVSTVDFYFSQNQTWVTTSLQVSRTSMAAVTAGKYAIFAGGSNTFNLGGSCFFNVDLFASGSPAITSLLSVNRTRIAAVAVGGIAIFAGGYNGVPVTTVDILDTGTLQWTVDALQIARYDLSAASLGCKVIFAGGLGVSVFENTVEVYDASIRQWNMYSTNNLFRTSLAPALSFARAQSAVVTLGGILGGLAIVAGGVQNGSSTSVIDYFTFCPNGFLSVIDGVCVCPAQMYFNTPTYECFACSNGQNCPAGTTDKDVLICPVGFVFYVVSLDYFRFFCKMGIAIPCPLGTYNNLSGLIDVTQCQNCPAGYSTLFEGTTLLSNCVFSPDLTSMKVTTAGNLSLSRTFVASASTSQVIVYYGGATILNSTSGIRLYVPSNVSEILNISSGTLLTNYFLSPRYFVTSASLGSKLFFAGGLVPFFVFNATSNISTSDPLQSAPSSSVDIFDAVKNTWSKTNLSVARYAMTSTTVMNSIVIFAGGSSPPTVSNLIPEDQGQCLFVVLICIPATRIVTCTDITSKFFALNGFNGKTIYLSFPSSSDMLAAFGGNPYPGSTTRYYVRYNVNGVSTQTSLSTSVSEIGPYKCSNDPIEFTNFGIFGVSACTTSDRPWDCVDITRNAISICAFGSLSSVSPYRCYFQPNVYTSTFGSPIPGSTIYYYIAYQNSALPNMSPLIQKSSGDIDVYTHTSNYIRRSNNSTCVLSVLLCIDNSFPNNCVDRTSAFIWLGGVSNNIIKWSYSSMVTAFGNSYSGYTQRIWVYYYQGGTVQVVSANFASTIGPISCDSNFVTFQSSGANASAAVDMYNIDTDTWTNSTLSSARCALASASTFNWSLFAGGSNTVPPLILNTSSVVDIYYAPNKTWSVSSLSFPRASLAGVAVGDFVMFAGGFSGPTASNTSVYNASTIIDIYNVATKTWFISYLSVPRGFISGAVSGSKAVFIGGGIYVPGSSLCVSYATIDMLDISTFRNTFISLAPLSSYYASTLVNGNSVFMSGGFTNSNYVIDSAIYRFYFCSIGAAFVSSTGCICPPGTLDNGTHCDICTAGFYCPVSQVLILPIICPIGYFCPSGVTLPLACSPGQYGATLGLSSSSCTGSCSGGYYCPAASSSRTQYICPPGYFCPNSTIIPCPSGTYGPTIGVAVSNSSCLSCPVGYYCPAGSSAPNNVPCMNNTALFGASNLSIPLGYRYAGVASVGNKAVFIGGQGINDCLNSADVFDSVTNSWHNYQNLLNVPRYWMITAVVKNLGFFAGGLACPIQSASQSVTVFDSISNNFYEFGSPISYGRFLGAGCGVVDSALFVGGFLSQMGYPTSNAVEILNVTTATIKSDSVVLSAARGWLSGVAVGAKCAFAGGLEAWGGTGVSTVDIFDYYSNVWTTASLSVARFSLTATSVGTLALFAGGTTNSVDIFDTAFNTWTVNTLPSYVSNLAESIGVGVPMTSTSVGCIALIYANGLLNVFNSVSMSWRTVAVSIQRYSAMAATAGLFGILLGGTSSTRIFYPNVDYVYYGGCIGGILTDSGICTCPAGTYLLDMACLNCSVGNFCPSGSVVEVACPPGYYCPTQGMKSPIICPFGSFCTGGIASPLPCLQSPAGVTCAAGTSMPLPTYCSISLGSPFPTFFVLKHPNFNSPFGFCRSRLGTQYLCLKGGSTPQSFTFVDNQYWSSSFPPTYKGFSSASNPGYYLCVDDDGSSTGYIGALYLEILLVPPPSYFVFLPTSSGIFFTFYNPYFSGFVLGYDAATDMVLMVRSNDVRATSWSVSSIVYQSPSIDLNNPFKNDPVYFNKMGQLSATKTYMRFCPNCDVDKQYIYYQRLSNPTSVSYYALLISSFSSANNVLGADFNMFSKLTDSIASVNPWTYCKYSDFASSFGFPAYCAPNIGRVNTRVPQWHSANDPASQSNVYFLAETSRGSCLASSMNCSTGFSFNFVFGSCVANSFFSGVGLFKFSLSASQPYLIGNTFKVDIIFSYPSPVFISNGTTCVLSLNVYNTFGSFQQSAAYVAGNGTSTLSFAYKILGGDVVSLFDYSSSLPLVGCNLFTSYFGNIFSLDNFTFPAPLSTASLSGAQSISFNYSSVNPTPDATSSLVCYSNELNVVDAGTFINCSISSRFRSTRVEASSSIFSPAIYPLPANLNSFLIRNTDSFGMQALVNPVVSVLDLFSLGYDITLVPGVKSCHELGNVIFPTVSDSATLNFTIKTGTDVGIYAFWDGVSSNVALVAVIDDPDSIDGIQYFA